MIYFKNILSFLLKMFAELKGIKLYLHQQKQKDK